MSSCALLIIRASGDRLERINERVCVIKFSLIQDDDMLIGSRKLSHSDRGAGFGHINSSESHQSTAARYETDLLSVQPAPIT